MKMYEKSIKIDWAIQNMDKLSFLATLKDTLSPENEKRVECWNEFAHRVNIAAIRPEMDSDYQQVEVKPEIISELAPYVSCDPMCGVRLSVLTGSCKVSMNARGISSVFWSYLNSSPLIKDVWQGLYDDFLKWKAERDEPNF